MRETITNRQVAVALTRQYIRAVWGTYPGEVLDDEGHLLTLALRGAGLTENQAWHLQMRVFSSAQAHGSAAMVAECESYLDTLASDAAAPRAATDPAARPGR